MRLLSVKTCEIGIDPDGRPEHPGEGPPLRRPLETAEPAAGVDAAPGLTAARHEDAVPGGEPDEIGLRRDAPAADARALRRRYSDGSSSTGTPAGTSAGGATSASGAGIGSSESVSAGSVTGAAESGVASGSAGGSPAT